MISTVGIDKIYKAKIYWDVRDSEPHLQLLLGPQFSSSFLVFT